MEGRGDVRPFSFCLNVIILGCVLLSDNKLSLRAKVIVSSKAVVNVADIDDLCFLRWLYCAPLNECFLRWLYCAPLNECFLRWLYCAPLNECFLRWLYCAPLNECFLRWLYCAPLNECRLIEGIFSGTHFQSSYQFIHRENWVLNAKISRYFKTRAHTYDGAGNMADAIIGCTANFMKSVPQAHYYHCACHSLNVALP